MAATIASLRRDLANLARELGALSVAPQSPFASPEEGLLANLAGSAIQATQHLKVVDVGGGPQVSTQADLDACASHSQAIADKLDQVIRQPPEVSYTSTTLFNEARNAINDAYAIS